MGGSGGGGFIPPTTQALQKKIEQAWKEEQKRLQGDVNRFLQDLLTQFNQRDPEAVKAKLEDIGKEIEAFGDIQTFLFGGSVAKHTYVDGLSDVDALAILDRAELKGESPKTIINTFYKILNDNLSRDKVHSVEKGTLAVTVNYRDGTQLQLLPAVRSRDRIHIADATGKSWKETNPQAFQRKLTRSNERLNHSFVPAIKLMKSVVSDFPNQRQITGYHVESLAIQAAKGYQGPKTPKALLLHLLGHASSRVLKPIQDATGQSRIVDSYLGKANSNQRRNVSLALSAAKRRLEAATSLAQWRVFFEE